MFVGLYTRIEPVRLSIFLAMGLLAGCGDDGGTTVGTDTQASTGTGDTTGAPTTGAPTTTSTGTDTDASSTTTDAATTTTGETTAVSAGTTTGDMTTTGTGTETEGPDPECVELMQGMTDPPVPSGWVKCGDKLPHRVAAEVCQVPATPSSCTLQEPGQECETNDDCVERPFGSCQQASLGFITCGCVYGCESDADCDEGHVCRCAGDVLGPATICVPSTCTDDSDCGDELCQFSQSEGYDCGPSVVNGACTTPNDVCETDAPCGENPCGFVDDKWECSPAVCGRPFFVEAEAVTAPATARDDWRALAAVRVAPAELREALAAHWTQIGLAEHASVASFARHILQLMTVGAPPELVLATQQALADEVEHARLCFALASGYAGAGVGPGPFAQAQAPAAGDLEAVVAAVIREACVGETLSALEAREAAARAEEPGLRRILGRIADDEQRHAELGWRFVQWALARAGADLRARAGAVFAAAIADAEATIATLAAEPPAPELRPHGVIDAPLRAALWQEGLRALVRPTADLLAA